MDDSKRQNSVNMLIGAINSIDHGHMDPWFHRKQTAREWCAKLEPAVCVEMAPRILNDMVRIRLDGRFNAAARMTDLLVHTVERGNQG